MSKVRLIITSIVSIVLVSILLLGSTYSIFTSEEISEDANVYTTGNLNISYKLDSSNVTITDVTPMTEEEADSVKPYRITITNSGNVPYRFNVILSDTTASDVINYDYIMTKVGYLDAKPLGDCTDNIIAGDVVLLAGSSVDIDVRIWLDSTLPNTEMGKSFYAKLSIDGLAVYDNSDYIDNSNLSLRYMNTSSANNFRSDSYSTYIKNASFVDYINTDNASIDITTNEKIMWDMSKKQDNSVVAWLEPNTEKGYYDLYIGANYKIYAQNLNAFFFGMTSLENVNLENFDTSFVTSMNSMFRNCSSLTSLDVSNFNTSAVTNMYYLFDSCSSLTFLDVNNFDTSKVTNMAYMFANCSSLTSLDVSDFNTSAVTNISFMFRNCSSLTSLDVSNFDTSKVTNMAYMFESCSSLVSLDVSNFNTSKVTDVVAMFRNCSSLTFLDVSNFDTSKVTNMSSMFNICSSLTNLDLSNFDTSSVTSMGAMLANCVNLTSLDLSNFDTSKVTDMSEMFRNSSKLIATITIRNNSTTYKNMFVNAASAEGARITVNYIGDDTTTTDVNENTENLVDSMIATKPSGSNVVKGSLVV